MVIYFLGFEALFLLSPMSVAFLEPEIHPAVDRSLPTPPTIAKHLYVHEGFLVIPRYVVSRPCINYLVLSCVNSLLVIRDRHCRILAATFEKPNQQIHCFCSNRCIFMWGAYFCMCAYKR